MITLINEFLSGRGAIFGICGAERLDAARYGSFTPFVNSDIEKRIDPRAILPDAKSIIVAGVGHSVPDGGSLSSLGVNHDYHKKMKTMLRELVALLQEKISFSHKILVDSGALDERALAVRAGIGFWGKNHLVISKEFGSLFNIGCVLTDVPEDVFYVPGNCLIPAYVLGADPSHSEQFPDTNFGRKAAAPLCPSGAWDKPTCGNFPRTQKYKSTDNPRNNPAENNTMARTDRSPMSCPSGCRLCADACPGKAITADGKFNALKCVSYLTQKDGELTENEMETIGHNLYGCDICRNVCPFNRHMPRTAPQYIDPEEWLALTDEELTNKYSHTAMAWRGAGILKRNAKAAADN